MVDERELNLIKLTLKLSREFTLTVETVMEVTGQPRDKCFLLMDELVSAEVATWYSPVLGILDYNILFSA